MILFSDCSTLEIAILCVPVGCGFSGLILWIWILVFGVSISRNFRELVFRGFELHRSGFAGF